MCLLRYIYFLGRNQAIDCDPVKYGRKQQGHGGMLANDPVNDMMVNLRYETVCCKNSSVYEDFVYVYVTESAWETIAKLDELFLAYGKHYWMYRPFWNSLSADDQKEAAKYYSINPDVDLLD